MCIRDSAETAEKAKDGVKKGAYVLVDTEGTPDAVSYTHLDVYKRQVAASTVSLYI